MISSPIQSSDSHSSSKKKCPSTSSKQHTIIDDEIRRKVKTEESTDEVKIFSALAIPKNESDVDIEDRLSPVVEEPVSFIQD